MIQKMVKVLLILLIIVGIAFSISNFMTEPTQAYMKSEKLEIIDMGDFFAINCAGDGEGCYTVTPDPKPVK